MMATRQRERRSRVVLALLLLAPFPVALDAAAAPSPGSGPLDLALSGPSQVRTGEPFSLEGQLGAPGGAPLAFHQVEVWVHGTWLAPVLTDLVGRFSVTLALPDPGTSFFLARAHAGLPTETWSERGGLQVVASPGPPLGVGAEVGPLLDEATVRWSPPEDTGNGPITGYSIERAASLDGPFHLVGRAVASSSKLVVGADPGRTLHYRVRAENAAGPGLPSEPASLVVPPWPPADHLVLGFEEVLFCGRTASLPCGALAEGDVRTLGWDEEAEVTVTLGGLLSADGSGVGGARVETTLEVRDDGSPIHVRTRSLRTDGSGTLDGWTEPLGLPSPLRGACRDVSVDATGTYEGGASGETSFAFTLCREPPPEMSMVFAVHHCGGTEGCVDIRGGDTVLVEEGALTTVTPALRGRLTHEGEPLADATVRGAFHADGPPSSCALACDAPEPDRHETPWDERTDEQGFFLDSATFELDPQPATCLTLFVGVDAAHRDLAWGSRGFTYEVCPA